MTLRVTISLTISDAVLMTTRTNKLTLYLLVSSLLGAVFGIIESGGSLFVAYKRIIGPVKKKFENGLKLSKHEEKILKIQGMFNFNFEDMKEKSYTNSSETENNSFKKEGF